MPPMTPENKELLDDSERHTCEDLEDNWTMVTIKDGQGIIWDNSLITDATYNASPTTPIIQSVKYCPFCGERLGKVDAATEAVQEIIMEALAASCAGHISNDFKDQDRADKVLAVLGNGVQITVRPDLQKDFEPDESAGCARGGRVM